MSAGSAKGHHSSTGRCFDIGGTVLKALARFERFSEPFSGSTDPNSAGNGSIMRRGHARGRVSL